MKKNCPTYIWEVSRNCCKVVKESRKPTTDVETRHTA